MYYIPLVCLDLQIPVRKFFLAFPSGLARDYLVLPSLFRAYLVNGLSVSDAVTLHSNDSTPADFDSEVCHPCCSLLEPRPRFGCIVDGPQGMGLLGILLHSALVYGPKMDWI